ncbi:hypothetical protein B0G77_4492 [Paraburkholderia sp. BL10I2N1]|nr:hypothetical protein B0G77_4492 [Paraburkholderia sp. BL10I2N1]
MPFWDGRSQKCAAARTGGEIFVDVGPWGLELAIGAKRIGSRSRRCQKKTCHRQRELKTKSPTLVRPPKLKTSSATTARWSRRSARTWRGRACPVVATSQCGQARYLARRATTRVQQIITLPASPPSPLSRLPAQPLRSPSMRLPLRRSGYFARHRLPASWLFARFRRWCWRAKGLVAEM